MVNYRKSHTSIPLLLLSFLLRLIILGCSVTTLGIFAYFLATLTDHSLPIHTWLRAVTGIAGASTLYSILACTFVFCCGGILVLSAVAILLDIGFLGAWIYVVYETRGASDGCGRGTYVKTPIGHGIAGQSNTVTGGDGGITILPSLHTACRLQQAVFGVGLIAIVIFIFTILVELVLMRSHKKGKKYGPSPTNNYTSGRQRFAGLGNLVPFGRKKKDDYPLYPDEKQNPDALTASHPAPETGAYVPPTGTAVIDDTKDARYGHTSMLPPATTAPTNGFAYGYGDANPYSGTNTMTTNTTSTTTSPPNAHASTGYTGNF